MGNLANKMLEAMGIIADAAAASQNFDRTVQAQVISVNQQDATEYVVSYNGANYSAKGATGYTVQSIVWVTVPGNDFGQKLQIIGLSSSIDASTQVLKSSENEFETITSNLAQLNSQQSWNGNNIVLYERQAGRDNPTIDLLGLTDGERITNAINSSLYFEIGTTITTTFSNYTGEENFGIRCTFNHLSIGNDGVITLDINDFSGNPYYLIGESQKKVFSIPDAIEGLELLKIELFFENIPDEGSSITFNSFTFYGCRLVDRKDGLEAVMRFVNGSDNIIIPLEGKELDGADSLTFETVLCKDGILIENETELNSYNYQWYLKTLEDGTALRLLTPDWSEAAFCGTTVDWELDSEKKKIKQYKGIDSVVYMPTKIIESQIYDKVIKAEGDSERIQAFPDNSTENLVYYSKETKQYYKGGANGEYILTNLYSLANDSNITKLGVSCGDGETALFKPGNNVEAIILSSDIVWNNVVRPSPERTRETVYLQYLTNAVFYLKPGSGTINTLHSYIKSFRVIKKGWAEQIASKPNQLKIKADAFFMPKSFLQCKVSHKINSTNAKTEEEIITNSSSSYRIDFQIGDIYRGTGENKDKWYQSLAFGVKEGYEWPINMLQYAWYKNDELQETQSGASNGSTYRLITIVVPTDHNDTWKGEIYTDTNFFVCSYETIITSRPAPQDVESNTLIVDLVGQSLFLIKEDGTWPNNQAPSHTITAYLTYHDQTGNISFPTADECEFKWYLGVDENKVQLQAINNNEMSNEGTGAAIKSALGNSAFKEIKITGSVLEFVAKSPYLSTYIKNLITCEVTYSFTKDGETQEVIGHGQYEPSFVKNGQPGTNGTNFVCRFTTDGGNSFPEYLKASSYENPEDEIDLWNRSLSAVVKNVVTNELLKTTTTYYFDNGRTIATDSSGHLMLNSSHWFGGEPYAIYAICETVSEPKSTYYTAIPIVYSEDDWIQIVEPTTSLQVVFGQSGRLASGLPITITLANENFELDDPSIYNPGDYNYNDYLKVSIDQAVITVSLKETFEKYRGDKKIELLTLWSTDDKILAIPILLSSNRFEYAAINGWDGTSIKIDETNDTVLAPTAGFGKKENDNSFTGVMLGSIVPTGEGYEKIECDSITANKAIRTVNGVSQEIVPNKNTINKFYLDKSDIAEGRSEGQYYVTRGIKQGNTITYHFEKTLPPDFSGILGMNYGNTTFSLDSNTGSLFAKGHIEATSGKIGNMTIDGLGVQNNDNLVWIDSLTFHGVNGNKTYTSSQHITVENLVSGHSAGIIIGRISEGTYTLNLTNIGNGVGIYNSIRFVTSVIPINAEENQYIHNDVYAQWGAEYFTNTNGAVVNLPYTFTINEAATIGIVLLSDRGIAKQEIIDFKLERGNKATPWCASSHDEGSNCGNGNYSWRFSPTDGMFMWNGPQTTTPVFKIDKDGLYMNGNGTFTGTITAEDGGNIGGFFVSRTNGTLTSGTIGMGTDTYAFWAGDSNAEDAPFQILYNGTGKIGGFEIGTKSIINRSYNNRDQSTLALEKWSGTTLKASCALNYQTLTINSNGTQVYKENTPYLDMEITGSDNIKREITLNAAGYLNYYEGDSGSSIAFGQDCVFIRGYDKKLGKLQAKNFEGDDVAVTTVYGDVSNIKTMNTNTINITNSASAGWEKVNSVTVDGLSDTISIYVQKIGSVIVGVKLVDD